MSDHDQLAGRTLAQRYDLLELIGQGGMGAVYRARDRELDELVALKMIRSGLAASAAMIERFRSEVKLARRVTHTNVARTFELCNADGFMFCTMELVDGESLRRRLHRTGALPVGEAIAITCDVCDALTAAHAAGVIHRDIKPDNVLLASDGRVVVADFGVAAISVADGDRSGTPAYMAPEQARGEPSTPATDVYSLGVTLLEALTGIRAKELQSGPTVVDRLGASVVPPVLAGTEDVDPTLLAVIARATAFDARLRIQTAAAFRSELAGWADLSHRELAIPVRPAFGISAVRTVILIAPTVGDDDGVSRLYLAHAVYETTLQQLTRHTRLRVMSRVGDPHEPGATVVELRASRVLTAIVTSPDASGSSIVLRVPLSVEQITAAANAIANAIASSVGFDGAANDASSEAIDLLLQARHISQQDVALIGGALERLERANALLPGDPTIAACLAMAQVRYAFFSTGATTELISRATSLVRMALATGPHVADAQLAAGHLALNIGDGCDAAAHYRLAIACSPHLAEAHEYLGRLLLESGFLEPAVERLTMALAIAPSRSAILWDLSRAYALEQRWVDHDRAMADLATRDFDRPLLSSLLRLRFAVWRGDWSAVAAIRAEPRRDFDADLIESLLAVYLDGAWPAHREVLVRRAFDMRSSIRRRGAVIAQFVAEAAGFAGDVDTCIAMIELAITQGLFDFHWLERCPSLAVVRATDDLTPHRIRVKERANAILDALYGDHDVHELSETVMPSRS